MTDRNQERADWAENFTENFIGDRTDAEAVFWYGIYSLSMGFGTMFLYQLLDSTDWVALYASGFESRWFFYIPAAISWLMVSLFDSDFMRIIFKDMIALSVMGPFFGHWYAYGTYLMSYQNQDLDYWLGAFVWFCWTVFEELVQIILLPQVFSWADSARILN